MKKLFLFLALGASAFAASSVTQTMSNMTVGCNTTTCTNNFTANMTAGHAVVAFIFSSQTTYTISSATIAGDTATVDTGCRSNPRSVALLGCIYVNSLSNSASKTISVTVSGSSGRISILAFEFNLNGYTAAFDTSNTKDQSSLTTAPVGPALTLTGSNDIIVQAIGFTGSVVPSAVSAPWSSNFLTTVVDTPTYVAAIAASLDTASGTGPTWTTPNHTSELGGIALKLTAPPPPTVSCPSVTTGSVGTPYSSSVTATGGASPYSAYAIATGALPTGLSINATTGAVTGTPTTASGSPFTFTASVTGNDAQVGTSGTCTIAISATTPSGARRVQVVIL